MSEKVHSYNGIVQYKRLDYLDFCKVFAIFLVTVAHCAQQLSGNKFPTLMITKDSFISINMAIFMLSSGYVMNIEKMRQTSPQVFFVSKAVRLLVPMTTWYLIMCVVLSQSPRFAIYWSLYWYLGAMFVCLSLIKIISVYIPNNLFVCIFSILILTCIPLISFERSCYMIPFLWVGYSLHFYINQIGKYTTLIILLIFGIMYYFWDVRYSIYVAPFHIWDVDWHSIYALLFRLLVGVVGGIFVISASRLLIERRGFKWMRYFSKFGPYTLVFYTMSFVLNAVLARILWHFNFFITKPGLLDIAAILVAILSLTIIYYFQIVVKKNRWLSLFFLGEY